MLQFLARSLGFCLSSLFTEVALFKEGHLREYNYQFQIFHITQFQMHISNFQLGNKNHSNIYMQRVILSAAAEGVKITICTKVWLPSFSGF